MRIKNHLWIFCLFLCAINLVACKKDLGNYSYKEVNEGTISKLEISYTALRGQRLQIMPELSFTLDQTNDTTKYSYQWMITYPATENRKVIARTLRLDWLVDLPSADYKFNFSATDKATGLSWSKEMTLKVTSNIGDGWLVMNDINGMARLDFFNYSPASSNFQYYQDILAIQANLSLKGKPKLVYYCPRRDAFSLVSAKCIFVASDEESYVINTQNNNFVSPALLGSIFGTYNPAPFYPERVVSLGGTNRVVYMLTNKGDLSFEIALYSSPFGTRVNKESNGRQFAISPYFCESYRSDGQNYVLMYDTDNKRFMEHKMSNAYATIPVITGQNKLFVPGNMGMDLLYLANTPALGSQAYALFKNSQNQVYLARIVANYSTFSPVAFDQVKTAPELVNATQFAIDPVEGYVMYLVGSKIYRYNPSDQSNTLVLDLGTRKVSLIKYQKLVLTGSFSDARLTEYSRKLIVCSYDEASPTTSGKMELYTVPSLNGALSLYRSFDGLGKIIDVSYRE
ncbi:PKD-like family lipoprotein [Pedobacter sp. KR3-3]|uniref:PKD-like family lipoprotein n=1 Tax=Pedobacter albus TaxID=3113905 RepID=A0ABU7I412_9SPHI|nr:PKD-like family lipoprotein [Pedobacter sp. KR3-3]MEE1944203.1 PKD-like family lipoprotein [Pedobacter sp. KR3-3]